MRDRAGAHRAGLERHIEVAADEPFGAEFRRSLADDEHFRMRGRIGEFAGAVSGARDHGAVANQRGADRRFAAHFRRPRLGEGEAHRIAALALFGQIELLCGPPVDSAKRFSLAARGVRA